ncbi:CubicO group peptidase (beta-lactamase class C family) [Salirhabdus euzebyi]|uniref:CubicO group peptidase (Beta-lactamase class C family) n=1 Tax=Salirhabdus euzebyi TaxID=394506 RepID=A0A841Q6S9_9BACI|nr:serine hydrolase domain-containing protein [Salirhabdus euzebyi]MBB6454116.1 CubicO group peptidase (beta-lactamase class C family) [Salirhabdus euzebyi]
MWGDFEKKLKEQMDREHIVGAAVGAFRDGEIIYQKGFGVQNKATNKPVTEETIFGTASVTKSFTALAVMKLMEQGLLSINDSVIKYIPNLEIKGVYAMDKIKIHHLLTHSTGLAPVNRDESRLFFSDEVEFLTNNKHSILGKPNEYFSYSNDMFLLLGAIIEKVTGKLYRRYITEEILAPLKMNRTTMSIEEVTKLNNVSTPYIYDKQQKKHIEQMWPTLGVYEVGGGIRSCISDLLKYGSFYVNTPNLLSKSISETSVQKMWQPHINLTENSFYGYGLKVTPNYHGVTLVEHGGGQPGVSSNFGFIPEKNIVIVVLTNVSNIAVRDIWLKVVNTLLRLPIDTKEQVLPPTDLSKKELMKFVGAYASKEGYQFEVIIEDGKPLILIDQEKLEAYAADKKTLVLKNSSRSIPFYFTDNEVWGAFFGMRVMLKQ